MSTRRLPGYELWGQPNQTSKACARSAARRAFSLTSPITEGVVAMEAQRTARGSTTSQAAARSPLRLEHLCDQMRIRACLTRRGHAPAGPAGPPWCWPARTPAGPRAARGGPARASRGPHPGPGRQRRNGPRAASHAPSADFIAAGASVRASSAPACLRRSSASSRIASRRSRAPFATSRSSQAAGAPVIARHPCGPGQASSPRGQWASAQLAREFAHTFGLLNITRANKRRGSQVGSQSPPTSSHAQPSWEIVAPVQRHVRHHQATPGDPPDLIHTERLGLPG